RPSRCSEEEHCAAWMYRLERFDGPQASARRKQCCAELSRLTRPVHRRQGASKCSGHRGVRWWRLADLLGHKQLNVPETERNVRALERGLSDTATCHARQRHAERLQLGHEVLHCDDVAVRVDV